MNIVTLTSRQNAGVLIKLQVLLLAKTSEVRIGKVVTLNDKQK
jgi:hypothetical protein